MQFSENSRVWIYQSDRVLTDEESALLQKEADAFCKEWTAHNNQLKAQAYVKYNVFLVLMVDESQAGTSGCSIDKSVRFLKEVEARLNIDLFNRMIFAVKDTEGVRLFSRDEFEKALSSSSINEDTIVFNNLVKTKAELEQSWETPFAKSWHASFFQ